MILVTGGAGFIGSHVVEALVEAGEAVRVLDDFSSGRRENLSRVEPKVAVVEGSITDPEAVHAALQGVRDVIHLAACPSVARSFDEPRLVHDVNTSGTLEVLVAARAAGVRRLVYASSSSVYGALGPRPAREEDPARPLSPYGAQKLLGEHYCRVWSAEQGLPTVVLRFFNVYGPRQDPGSPYSGVISQFAERLLAAQPPRIHGDGLQERDFTFVSDIVAAVRAAATLPLPRFAVFNVATGRSSTVLDVFQALRDLLGVAVDPVFCPPRAGDIRVSRADVRALAGLGYHPRVDLPEGLRRTLDWMERRGARERG